MICGDAISSLSFLVFPAECFIKVYFVAGFLPGRGRGGGGVLVVLAYMCRCEGYGFQTVYSGIGYINQRV